MTDEKIKERVLLQERLNTCERARLLAFETKTLPRRDLELHINALKDLVWPVSVMLVVTERVVSDHCAALANETMQMDETDAAIREVVNAFLVWEYLDDNFSGEAFEGLQPKLAAVAAKCADKEATAETDTEKALAESSWQESNCQLSKRVCLACLQLSRNVCVVGW